MIITAKPQSWPRCDNEIRAYIFGFAELLKNRYKRKFTGIYLHGSLAMKSFFPPKSDMDFIIVSYDRLGADQAKSLNSVIAEYAQKCPVSGGVECSVVTLQTARDVPDRIPYELHYSGSCLNDAESYGREKFDDDLAAHFMCVKKRGVCICGKPVDQVFGEVTWQKFMDSIMSDFSWFAGNEKICEMPFYAVLNICRILQIVTEGNKKYLSKYEGALWGLKNLPDEHLPLIEKALKVYASGRPVEKNELKTGGAEWDKKALFAFRNYAKKKIIS